MRQIVLDTETTGLDPALGHRIVEVAGVELRNRQVSSRDFHRYLNPGRASDPGALEVHGLTEDFLREQPAFRDIVADFLDFVADAELIIHNAPFDVAFLDRELALLDLPPLSTHVAGITDTLRLAKQLHPGKRNSLDALCERYGVDNTARTLHGALLDARLLADVYLAMTRGQDSLIIDLGDTRSTVGQVPLQTGTLDLVVLPASDVELVAHALYLNDLDQASGNKCVWKQFTAAPQGSPRMLCPLGEGEAQRSLGVGVTEAKSARP